MSSAASHLHNCYVIREGKIDPWGTIALLDTSVSEPYKGSSQWRLSVSNQPGLKVWCERLVPYGNDRHFAKIEKGTVEVHRAKGSLVESIPFSEFVVVFLYRAYVHDNGYLESIIIEPPSWTRTLEALKQAAKGEMPCHLDNSPFVKVDEKFAGQYVMKMSESTLDDQAIVYTEDGTRIECMTHRPLSYKKWDPTGSRD